MSGAKRRIAVIDDDAIFVELMIDLLSTTEGYEVVSNSHPVETFAFVKDQQPDLIILDLMTGREETGWDALDRLRADPETADIPIIVCTAAASALRQNQPRLVSGPYLEAIAKPFDVDDLLALIERLLEQRHSRPVIQPS